MPLPEVFQTIHQVGRYASMMLTVWLAMMAAGSSCFGSIGKGCDMEKPREIVIHQSCNRPNLLLGCDRELVLLCGMLAAMLIFALVTWWGLAIGITLWILAVAVLSRMGKADPLMRLVYVRHVKYRPFYPAKSGIDAASVGTPRKWR